MGAPGKKWELLFENHLEFLGSYRGTVIRINDMVQVESDKPEFNYLIPGSKEPSAELLKKFSALQITPWAFRPQGGYPGLKETGSITYMRATEMPACPIPPKELEIRLVKDKTELYAYSDVQCRSFLENPEAYQAWAPFMHQTNEKNFGKSNQRFYLAFHAGKPAGCALALDTEKMTGLYALGTLPDMRKKGIGCTLTQRLISDAKSAGAEAVTLQVAAGSYAEFFFGKLSFHAEFTTAMMARG